MASKPNATTRRSYRPIPLGILGLCVCLAAAWVPGGSVQAGEKVHGVSVFGPKSLVYKEGEGFRYLNPNAPIGGTLHLPGGYFTKLNPFGLQGKPPHGVMDHVFEPLATRSWDDKDAYALYGLLASHFEVADDRKSVKIYLRPEAKFSDGTPLTADDVVFSYDLIFEPNMSPFLRLTWKKDVARLVKIDKHTVRIDLKTWRRDLLPTLLHPFKVYPKHIYGVAGADYSRDFDQKKPIGSGPYTVDRYVMGQSITLKRNPNYWGKDLCYQKGYLNWKKIQYNTYQAGDSFAVIQALKSGYLDHIASLPRDQFNRMGGEYFDKGYLKKAKFPLKRPAVMVCAVFNLRKPLFQDRELRKVITSLYDFDYINKNFFYGENERLVSYFNNRPELRGDKGPAKGKVKALIEKLAKKHNKKGVTHVPLSCIQQGPFELGTNRKTGKRYPIDAIITAANRRLDELGWKWDPKAQVRMKDGVPLQFEIMLNRPEIFHFSETLQRAGISVTVAKLSSLEYTSRRKNFAFDMCIGWFDGRKAPGCDLARNFFANEADVRGSRNVIGLKNPAIDELLDTMITSEDREVVSIYSKAFDRIMISQCYVVPLSWPTMDYVIYWSYLKRPKNYCYALWANWNVIGFWWIDMDEYRRIKKEIAGS